MKIRNNSWAEESSRRVNRLEQQQEKETALLLRAHGAVERSRALLSETDSLVRRSRRGNVKRALPDPCDSVAPD